MTYLLRHCYIWLVFVPLLTVSTVWFGTLCMILAPFIGSRAAGRLTAVPWSRFGMWLSRTEVDVQGREHILPGQSYVVVANHLSLYDIWVLYGWLDLDIRWVAKKEVRYIPIVGTACIALGHVFVDRANHERAIASLNAAKSRITQGTSVIFFPEGTRSRSGELQAFKKGAFRMAVELSLPILPVTLRGTREILPSDTSDLTPGRDVKMIIHPPIPVSSVENHDLDRLAGLSRTAILSGLDTPPEGLAQTA